jgi:hypothetical protein
MYFLPVPSLSIYQSSFPLGRPSRLGTTSSYGSKLHGSIISNSVTEGLTFHVYPRYYVAWFYCTAVTNLYGLKNYRVNLYFITLDIICTFTGPLFPWSRSILVTIGFEALNAVVMKISIFWNVTPCSLLKVNQRFEGTYRLHLQGRRISQERHQHESR